MSVMRQRRQRGAPRRMVPEGERRLDSEDEAAAARTVEGFEFHVKSFYISAPGADSLSAAQADAEHQPVEFSFLCLLLAWGQVGKNEMRAAERTAAFRVSLRFVHRLGHPAEKKPPPCRMGRSMIRKGE